MKDAMVLLGALMLTLTCTVLSQSCTSSCAGYRTCSFLNGSVSNISSLVNNSLICDKDTDATLGGLFAQISSCDMRRAAISVTQFLGMSGEAIGAIESLIDDEEFFNATCDWDVLAAVLCLYGSLPVDTGICTNGSLAKSNMFCKGECTLVMNKCLNLDKYVTMKTQVEDACKSLTSTDANTTDCYSSQVSQKGKLSAPVCPNKVTSTSLTGPYIVAGISLALAVVALVGLILVTCRGNGGNLQPNSF